MDEGDMPALSALREGSYFSRLESVVPPHTAPGWTSITTGVNPGEHGVFYFYDFADSPRIANATDVCAPRIWDYIEPLGGRSVVVNVPVTYPAREVSGVMVAGIPPWFVDERSAYPTQLYERLRQSGYEIDAPMGRSLEGRPDALVRRLIRTEEKRVNLFLDLLKEYEWSFGMVVITALDRMQHKLLGKGPRADEAVRRGYHEADRLVGRILSSLPEDVSFLVVSDHGFNARPVAFYPNTWLSQQGLLRVASPGRTHLSRVAHDLLDGRFSWLPTRLTKRYQGAKTSVRVIDSIDALDSRAYVPGTDGIVVVKSEEDVGPVATGLSALRDHDGREVCKVYRKDQVYSGARLGSAPELLIVPRGDVNIKTSPTAKRVVSTSDGHGANHGPNGVFFACGENVKKSQESDLRLEDVAPIALALMGVLPPDSMDGRMVHRVVAEPERTLRLSPVPVAVARRASYAFSEDDEKSVADNLRRIGYI